MGESRRFLKSEKKELVADQYTRRRSHAFFLFCLDNCVPCLIPWYFFSFMYKKNVFCLLLFPSVFLKQTHTNARMQLADVIFLLYFEDFFLYILSLAFSAFPFFNLHLLFSSGVTRPIAQTTTLFFNVVARSTSIFSFGKKPSRAFTLLESSSLFFICTFFSHSLFTFRKQRFFMGTVYCALYQRKEKEKNCCNEGKGFQKREK